MIPLIIALSIIALDQLSKYLISQAISLQESIPIIKNIFHLTLVYNSGMAFGMLKNQTLVFIGVSVIAIALIAYNVFTKKKEKLHRLELFAFSLVLGGAVGNLIDRLRFGYVVDFLDFRIWPVFNIADSAITIGVVLLIIKCIPSFAR